jgi:prepilin-type N-terminal cleavage/methylation domain-containing protein
VTVGPFQRHTHRGERGVTLVELLVTIAIMTIGFVSVISAFSTIELAVGTIGNDAQLTSLAREVGDYIESAQFAYITCGTYTAYDAALQSAIATQAVKLGASSYSAHVIQVAQASGGSHVVSGVSGSQPLIPIGGCSGSQPNDFGVQQIQFHVSTQGRSSASSTYTRIVYKRWN